MLIIKNLTNSAVDIPPSVRIKANETRILYAPGSTDFLDKLVLQGKIQVTEASGVASDIVADSTGTLFSPGSCSHAIVYNGSGKVLTDTATDQLAVVRVKTFTYADATHSTESMWVPQ